jgi:FKBP-type peptidyl-prolyl cis-trans isomerase 2
MRQAKDGDKVKVHYTKKLENGRVLDASEGGYPLEIKIGRNLVPLFENAIKGMEIGQRKTITVPPEKAYGPWRGDLKIDLRRSALTKKMSLNIGRELSIRKDDGSLTNAVIVDVRKDTVTLDMNHPLAGKPIFVDIEVVEIC